MKMPIFLYYLRKGSVNATSISGGRIKLEALRSFAMIGFKRNCKHALAELFGGWCTSPEYWPKPDWKTFNLMFVFRLDSMLFDMADEPIFREE